MPAIANAGDLDRRQTLLLAWWRGAKEAWRKRVAEFVVDGMLGRYRRDLANFSLSPEPDAAFVAILRTGASSHLTSASAPRKPDARQILCQPAASRARKLTMFTSDTIREFVRAPMPATRRIAPGPRFSIVMPSFRHARFIERSLNSVINQEYEGTELIVMDGGSDDGTREILDRYSRHIAVWHSERDAGQSDALNKGFAHATGEIFGWLNSDDLYLPGALHHAAHIFAAYPQIDVVYGRLAHHRCAWIGSWITFRRSPRPAGDWSRRVSSATRSRCSGVARCTSGSVSSTRQLHYTMDYDLMLRMINTPAPAAFFRTDRPLGCFRGYHGQKTGSANSPVPQEHRRIAAQRGTSWKYNIGGQLWRTFYRVTRCAEFLARGRRDYLLRRLKGHSHPRERARRAEA